MEEIIYMTHSRIKIQNNHKRMEQSVKKVAACIYTGISFKFLHLNPEHHSQSEMLEMGVGGRDLL